MAMELAAQEKRAVCCSMPTARFKMSDSERDSRTSHICCPNHTLNQITCDQQRTVSSCAHDDESIDDRAHCAGVKCVRIFATDQGWCETRNSAVSSHDENEVG